MKYTVKEQDFIKSFAFEFFRKNKLCRYVAETCKNEEIRKDLLDLLNSGQTNIDSLNPEMKELFELGKLM